MKSKRRTRNVIIKGLFLALLWVGLVAGYASGGEVAGNVTHLSGPLLAKKGDGSTRVLKIQSEVEEGDTLVTAKRTYAKIKFGDGGEVTLKPETQFKVEHFSFNPDAPADDSAVVNLIKGGLRSVSGKIGKRGNEDAYEMKTPTATIGIRGSGWLADIIPPIAGGVLPPGLYVAVTHGGILLSNGGGSQLFREGQFGFVPSLTLPPVILPHNPGITFTPPPSMNTHSSSKQGAGATDTPGVDCEYR